MIINSIKQADVDESTLELKNGKIALKDLGWVAFNNQQVIGDDMDLNSQGDGLKSKNLLFKKTSPYSLVRIYDASQDNTAKNFEGAIFNITNMGDKLSVNTNKGMIDIPKGVSILVANRIDSFQIIDTNSKIFETGYMPVVYAGDSILNNRVSPAKMLFIKSRYSGILALEAKMQRNHEYQSHLKENGIYEQVSSIDNTATLNNNVFWCVKQGTTGNSEPSFDTSKVGQITNDGTVEWMYMGNMPQYIEMSTQQTAPQFKTIESYDVSSGAWSVESGAFKASISIADLTTNSVAWVSPLSSSDDLWINYGVKMLGKTKNGALEIYAKTKPLQNIKVTITYKV